MYHLAIACLGILKIQFLDLQCSDGHLKGHLCLHLLLRLLAVDSISRRPKSIIRQAGPVVEASVLF